MTIKDEIRRFEKELSETLEQQETMLREWDNTDLHQRLQSVKMALHKMWFFYEKAADLAQYMKDVFPPYPFEEIKSFRQQLRKSGHCIDDFIKEDYHPVVTDFYIDSYRRFVSLLDAEEQLVKAEEIIAGKECELLMMLEKSYSLLLELLLQTYQTIKKKDKGTLHLAWVNMLARYEEIDWPKDRKRFEQHLQNIFPWDNPTAMQLQTHYTALYNDFIQTEAGKVYMQHRSDNQKLAIALAKTDCSQDDLYAMLRHAKQLEMLKDKINSLPIVSDKLPAAQPRKVANTKTVTPRRSPHFLETPAFVYKFCSSAFDGQRRLTVLFQYLRKEYEPARTWIDPDTNPDDFLSLFSGGKSDKVIVWTESKQKLFALFKRMKERKIITTPKGYGIWTIVQNHFSDWHGNMFHNLNKEHMPEERVFSAIEAFIDILDPAVTSAAQLDEYAKKVGRTFGNR